MAHRARQYPSRGCRESGRGKEGSFWTAKLYRFEEEERPGRLRAPNLTALVGTAFVAGLIVAYQALFVPKAVAETYLRGMRPNGGFDEALGNDAADKRTK